MTLIDSWHTTAFPKQLHLNKEQNRISFYLLQSTEACVHTFLQGFEGLRWDLPIIPWDTEVQTLRTATFNTTPLNLTSKHSGRTHSVIRSRSSSTQSHRCFVHIALKSFYLNLWDSAQTHNWVRIVSQTHNTSLLKHSSVLNSH